MDTINSQIDFGTQSTCEALQLFNGTRNGKECPTSRTDQSPLDIPKQKCPYMENVVTACYVIVKIIHNLSVTMHA